MCAKIGPCWNSKLRPPPSLSTTRLVPMMSAGIRSGVNWIRLKDRSIAWLSVRTSRVLPRPGTPSSNTCPPPKRAIRVPSTMSSCPTIIFPISARMAAKLSRNDWILSSTLICVVRPSLSFSLKSLLGLLKNPLPVRPLDADVGYDSAHFNPGVRAQNRFHPPLRIEMNAFAWHWRGGRPFLHPPASTHFKSSK